MLKLVCLERRESVFVILAHSCRIDGKPFSNISYAYRKHLISFFHSSLRVASPVFSIRSNTSFCYMDMDSITGSNISLFANCLDRIPIFVLATVLTIIGTESHNVSGDDLSSGARLSAPFTHIFRTVKKA